MHLLGLQPGLGKIDQLLRFIPDVSQRCVNFFLIEDDNTISETLIFNLTVTNPGPGKVLQPYDMTTIIILDDDGSYVCTFKWHLLLSPTYSDTIICLWEGD